jgi:hypothetical protein
MKGGPKIIRPYVEVLLQTDIAGHMAKTVNGCAAGFTVRFARYITMD